MCQNKAADMIDCLLLEALGESARRRPPKLKRITRVAVR